MEEPKDPNLNREKTRDEVESYLNGEKPKENLVTPEIVPTEQEINESYERTKVNLGGDFFSMSDFARNEGIIDGWKGASVDEKSLLSKIVNALVSQGKFRKSGDKYFVVPEEDQPKETVENKPVEKLTEKIEPPDVPAELIFEIKNETISDEDNKKINDAIAYINALAKQFDRKNESKKSLGSLIYNVDRENLEEAIKHVKIGLEVNVLKPEEAKEALRLLGVKTVEEKVEPKVEEVTAEVVEPEEKKWEFSKDRKNNMLEYTSGIIGRLEASDNEKDKNIAVEIKFFYGEIFGCNDFQTLNDILTKYWRMFLPIEQEKILSIAGLKINLASDSLEIDEDIATSPVSSALPVSPAEPEPKSPDSQQPVQSEKEQVPPVTPTPPQPENIPGGNPPPETPVETEAERIARIEREIQMELDGARAEYAKLLVDHKNAVRQKKHWYTKVLADLGMVKQMPEADRPEDLRNAENNYIQAKKKKAQNMNLFDKSEIRQNKNVVVGELNFIHTFDEGYKFNPELVKEAENEAENLHNLVGNIQRKEWENKNGILDTMTPVEKDARLKQIEKERSIAKKALDKWKSVPIGVRAFALPILIGVGVAATSVGGLAAGASYAAMRGARAIGGITSSKYAGNKADKRSAKTIEKDRNIAKENLGKEMSADNYEEKEREWMRYMESEENKKKRQKIYKALAMVGAGGVGGLVAGGVEGMAFQHGNIGSFLPHKPVDSVQPKIHVSEAVPVKPSTLTTSVPETPKAPVDQDVIFNQKPVGSIPPEAPVAPGVKVPTEVASENATPPSAPVEPNVPANPSISKVLENTQNEKIPPIEETANKIYHRFDHFFDKNQPAPAPKIEDVIKPIESKFNTQLGHPDYPENDGSSYLGDNPSQTDFVGSVQTPKVSIHSMVDPKEDVFSPEERFAHQPNINLLDNIHKVKLNDIENFGKIKNPVGIHTTSEVVPVHTPYTSAEILSKTIEDHRNLGSLAKPPEIPAFGQPVPPMNLAENIPTTQSAHSFDFTFENQTHHIDIADFADCKGLMFDGEKIADIIPIHDGQSKIMPLLDKYQEGSQYSAIREAYNTLKRKMILDDGTLKGYKNLHIPSDEKGGIISVSIGENATKLNNGTDVDNTMKVFLNGKEIAKGVVTENGPKIDVYESLKNKSMLGFLKTDSVYERAFKKVMPLLGTFVKAK